MVWAFWERKLREVRLGKLRKGAGGQMPQSLGAPEMYLGPGNHMLGLTDVGLGDPVNPPLLGALLSFEK